jgi:serine/threonine-protein kinase
MSPEQCEGKGLIDHRSDVYSLGIVMYELLTGVVPFPGEGFGEVLVAHLTKQAAKPSTVNTNLPASIESIVLHAIEKDRNRRFQNMQEFLEAVENPEAHLARWNALPDYSSAPRAGAGAATMRTMPVAQPHKSGRTLALDDGAPPATPGGQPRPTTLEGAAAEVTLSPTRVPRNRGPIIAVAAAVVALAGVGGWLALSKGPSSSTENTTPAAVAPPAVETSKPVTPPPAAAGEEVTIHVTSDPVGAKVYRADRSDAEKQPTPISFKMHRGDPPFDIQLRLEGYLPQTRTITSDESAKLIVALTKAPVVAPKAEVVEEAKPVTSPVSNVTKPPKSSHGSHGDKIAKPKKSNSSDPDGIIQPEF